MGSDEGSPSFKPASFADRMKNAASAPIIFIFDWDDTLLPTFALRLESATDIAFGPISRYLIKNRFYPANFIKNLKESLNAQLPGDQKDRIEFHLVTAADRRWIEESGKFLLRYLLCKMATSIKSMLLYVVGKCIKTQKRFSQAPAICSRY